MEYLTPCDISDIYKETSILYAKGGSVRHTLVLKKNEAIFGCLTTIMNTFRLVVINWIF